MIHSISCKVWSEAGHVKYVKNDHQKACACQAREFKPGGAGRPSAGFEVIPAVWKIGFFGAPLYYQIRIIRNPR